MLSLLQNALDEIKLAVVILDPDKNIVYRNKHANSLFGGDSAAIENMIGLLDTDTQFKKGENIMIKPFSLQGSLFQQAVSILPYSVLKIPPAGTNWRS